MAPVSKKRRNNQGKGFSRFTHSAKSVNSKLAKSREIAAEEESERKERRQDESVLVVVVVGLYDKVCGVKPCRLRPAAREEKTGVVKIASSKERD